MSGQKIDLALAFMLSQPGSAAAVLEQRPLDEVADFLTDLPHRQTAAVLKQMLPHYIARLCNHLAPSTAASFLSDMSIETVAAILRITEPQVQQAILAVLPDKTRIQCHLLLSYPETAVGAWMQTRFACVPHDYSCDQALDYLASVLTANVPATEEEADHTPIIVIDRERRPIGSAAFGDLYRAPPEKLINSILKTTPQILSAQVSVKAALDNAVWQQHEYVAVIGRDQKIVGLLRHLDLRRAMTLLAQTIEEPQGSDPVSGLVQVYGQTLFALFNTLWMVGESKQR